MAGAQPVSRKAMASACRHLPPQANNFFHKGGITTGRPDRFSSAVTIDSLGG